MTRNVYLLSNPSHYINALEYIEQQQKKDDYNILIIVTQFVKGINDISEVLKVDCWAETTLIDYNSFKTDPAKIKTKKAVFQKLYKLLSTMQFDNMVVGNFGDDLFYGLMVQLRAGKHKIIALDDGIPSINILKSRSSGTDYKRYHIGSLRKIVKCFLSYGIFFPFKSTIPEVTFFSAYDLEVGPKDTLIRNDLSMLKGRLQSKVVDTQLVYFIGSHVIERGIVGRDAYMEYLGLIKKYYTGLGLQPVYVAHRGERKENLDSIRLLFDVIRFDMPLEIAFIKEEKLPATFASFFSSALFSLRKILQPEVRIDAFRFDDDVIIGSDNEPKSDIINVYNQVEITENINLIPKSALLQA